MKLDYLIKQLKNAQKKHGNIDVCVTLPDEDQKIISILNISMDNFKHSVPKKFQDENGDCFCVLINTFD
jgi:hypothetical protein